MEVMDSIAGEADHLDRQSEHDEHDRHSEHSDHDQNAADPEGSKCSEQFTCASELHFIWTRWPQVKLLMCTAGRYDPLYRSSEEPLGIADRRFFMGQIPILSTKHRRHYSWTTTTSSNSNRNKNKTAMVAAVMADNY